MDQGKILRECAYGAYLNGMKYKDIAEKYKVSMHTVKSWKQRYNWKREGAYNMKKDARQQTRMHTKQRANRDALQETIYQDLLHQLQGNKISGAHYTDLVADYMALWNIKNNLIADIEERGVVVEWSNGNRQGKKKNDSVNELNKTNAQMTKLLAELGLKATEFEKDEDDETPDV
ncbi:P27 family phage terminase small subunit [Bacillus sp. 196mf]|uniref:P27 family phage terminase small subunit n=1 Tax=Bacillus sp. 196mf TaxID=1761754 RepID=UPI000D7BFF02|nr:P27 family phage terminase small subunit [Bacillus sp. 196mf]PYE89376.1 putative ATPase subunit gpP of terminase [Bacillus sp. 196mf]